MAISDDILNLNPNNDFLTPSSKRNLVSGTIEGLIQEGYSGRKALDLYKQVGLGIRESEFYALYNAVSAEYRQARRVQFLDDNAQLYDGILAKSRYEITENYRLAATLFVQDPETGDTFEMTYAFDTPTLGSRAKLEEQMLENARRSDSYAGVNILDLRIIRGYRRGVL